jgi:hypothetical protein
MCKVRIFPWHEMADVGAPVLFRGKTIGKHAGIEIIHMFVDGDVGRHECVEQEEIQI